jgi:S-adenosyl-L-methionine hydrolase (adenosine-forming)
MTRRESLIALLTDFGTRDPYVAAVKAVLSASTDASVLDLSHEIGDFDTFEAAVFLQAVAHYFPRCDETREVIFLVVVDPGVGTSRRLIAALEDGRIFLAPDNGVLSLIATTATRYWSIEREDLYLANGSTTFHGRDRLAPVAAAIANGVALEELGPSVSAASLHTLDYDHPLYDADSARGTIIALDHYGNAITDIEVSRIGELSAWELAAGQHHVRNAAEAYGEAPPDEPFMIAGSRGTIEISIANASAADLLQLGRRDRVEIRRRA